MGKTLVVLGTFCFAMAAFAHFHGAFSESAVSVLSITATARDDSAHIATVEASDVAPSSDGGATWRWTPVMQVWNQPSTAVLGEAKSGWSLLFSH
ncbi:hypothetical protein LGM89_26735 [Burkholderia sp. AU31624]|uniref:hypothetical protein n=1 Tax=Burkholderia sp. AU31624 TaxID=2879629 RepID=UPI001CF10402|nr:hypothetical protein [Burkholderia sp. AU31624]MCA8256878.1 hypothetical protein [Burkholderia sp. AU31624]